MRTCLHCTKDIPETRNKNAKYCSNTCTRSVAAARNLARSKRLTKERQLERDRSLTCLNCGEPIKKGSHHNIKHCSRACRYQYFYKLKKDSRPEKLMLDRARQRAKNGGYICELEEKDIKIPTHCEVLGLLLYESDGWGEDCSPSLDKIIPKLGYVKGNVRVISNRANRLKSNATFREIEALYNDFKKRETYSGGENLCI